MSKKNYVEIPNVFSEKEPPEFRPHGRGGVDYFVGVEQVDGGYVYTVLRFKSHAEYVLYRQING